MRIDDDVFATAMFLCGIVVFAWGMVCLIERFHPPARQPKKTAADFRPYPYLAVAVILASGLWMMVPALVPKLRPLLLPTICLGVSLLFLGGGCYGVLLPSRCTQQVSGVFLEAELIRSIRMRDRERPVFRLEWGGEVYFVGTRDSFPWPRVSESFSKGHSYSFFINPHYPYEAILERRISGGTVYRFSGGIMFLFFFFMVLTK